MLPGDTTPGQVPQRLELYNKARYTHAVTVMFMSKVNDERRREMMEELREYVPDAEFPENLFHYCWSSYPTRVARELLLA